MATEDSNGDFIYLPTSKDEVDRLIQTHGDLFSDSQCKVCSAVLISESQKLAHYQSKKHESKVRRFMSIQKEVEEPIAKKIKPSTDSPPTDNDEDRDKTCHVCNMTFSSKVVAESHYQGKIHAKNLRLKTFGPQAQPVKLKKENGQAAKSFAADDPNCFCPICKASFNNPLMAQQHYVGKKHKKQLTKQKLIETYGPSPTPASTIKGYPCTVCNLELNSVEQYEAHISGAKHKNNAKQKKEVNSFVNPLVNHEYEYGYGQQEEDWGSLKQDYE